MKVYGLGSDVHSGGGHGDPGYSHIGIVREGLYNSDDYPPLFTTREAAEAYRAAGKEWQQMHIVELEILDAEIIG